MLSGACKSHACDARVPVQVTGRGELNRTDLDAFEAEVLAEVHVTLLDGREVSLMGVGGAPAGDCVHHRSLRTPRLPQL